ncbi:autotransporter outer membrane beta-barrel domain-containing protein, partial [Leptotrichia wadei]
SEVTSIGMYVDTSGVRYTNPIDGIQNLPKLGKVDLYFGPEATLYTNSKAIRIGDKVDVNGNVTKSNILKPFNDALSRLPGGAKVNVLSASLTWQVLAKLDSNNQLSEIYMSKVPYHSFAYDNDKSLVNFTNNLDNIYEIARQESAEKVIFNKLNSLGNGEGHILAQAFDQMRGHIYGGVQQRIKSTSDILGGEISSLRSERNVSKDSNKFKAFGQRNEFKTDTAGMPDWYSNAGGFAFVHEDETVRLGQSSGWSAGVVNNYFTFKDLSKSYENQAMAKVGVFKSIPLDANGTFILSLGGDGFFGRNDMKRRFWVVDQQFRAKASYYSYGAGLNAGLEKSFVVNDGFSIVPNLGIRAEYGRFSSIHEKGDMALNVKSDDYVSVKPSVGIDFRYNQEVFKNSNLTASLGFAYENEIGKLYDVENEARIVGAWTDYFGIRGDKEDKRGNFKSDLKLGLDNGRFGFNVNTGYDSKGHNFRAGLGLKVLY